MKIEIEVPDIKTAVDAVNNAIALYGDTVFAILMGCEVSAKAASLTKLSDEELKKRFNCMKSIYQQLEAIEKQI